MYLLAKRKETEVKTKFVNLLLGSVFIFSMSGVACADTFNDNFDGGASDSHWMAIMGDWSYVSDGSGGYDYQGVGTSEYAASAANDGAGYLNDGLSISAVFQYTPDFSSTSHSNGNIFFSLNDTVTGYEGYAVGLDYADHHGTGVKDYSLRISHSNVNTPIGYSFLQGVALDTIFQFDILVGSSTFDVTLSDYITGAQLAIVNNIQLVPGSLGGMVGLDTSGTILAKKFKASGELLPTSAVPEPTTVLLFGTGIAGLAAVGRRRK